MKLSAVALLLMGTCATILLGVGDAPPRTGPQTEKRFPPLKVPAGFKATLFACDPLIEYPSVISAGPKPGSIFVAIDYMTGLGTEIIRRDEIRLVADTDGDGYADRATVYAKGFNSIQGLAYHDGTVYVMHAPYLTALRDAKGTGVADERRDLLTGLGLTPEQNPVRLHCANGVAVGHDGWLYLAMGDNGVNVLRPEGDRLIVHGGSILRCRPDGRDLHIFATGLRNIYDVAFDAEMNVFVRDNENDGGTYMIRVCHSFHGADHGYPYLYEDRPDEAMPPLADLGLGSSAGGVCYLETQFPPEYRGNLFFCEWGRSLVRYETRRAGSGFGKVKQIEFAAGAANDPYGFKPTDVVVQRDGTLIVSDWADGQRPKRGRGRIYHIAHAGSAPGASVKTNPPSLNSESYAERCDAQIAIERLGRDGLKAALAKGLGVRGRMHAVWALARIAGPAAIEELLTIAQTDAEPSVRAQAGRAVADLADPVLTKHRLDAGAGGGKLAERLAGLAQNQGDRLLLEIVIALGRLQWRGAPDWLAKNVRRPDAALAHASMQTLRRSGNWPALLKLLDLPNSAPMRGIALRAVADRYEPIVVDGLIERLRTEKDPSRRREYADTLTRLYKKPGPWTYWGYRPAPRPANTVAWDKSDAIALALDHVLGDSDLSVRGAVLRRMQREKVPAPTATLATWLKSETEPERATAIIAALAGRPNAETRSLLETVVRDSNHTAANRLAALNLMLSAAGDASLPLALAQKLDDGPVLAEVLRRAAKASKLAAMPVLTKKWASSHAEVRAAAIESLGELGAPAGRAPAIALLADADVRVRRAAAGAAGKLAAKDAVEPLLKLMSDADAGVRRASLDSLRLLREPRAVPRAVAALEDRETELSALEYLRELGGPAQIAAVVAVAKRNPSAEISAAAIRALVKWQEEKPSLAVAEVQGSTGNLVSWRIEGPTPAQDTAKIVAQLIRPGLDDRARPQFAGGAESRLLLNSKDTVTNVPPLWLAYTDVAVTEPTTVQFLASSRGSLRVWLNGKSLHQRDKIRPFQIDSERFLATLEKGTNRIVVQTGSANGVAEFHLHFRRQHAKAEHERLTQAALNRAGSAVRGRKVFLDAEKSQCLKCHRLGTQGERIGPELTGIGSRFARVYLVESILEPSRSIAPSFTTQVVALKNGKIVTGVKLAETEALLTLADTQGQKHILAKADIDEQRPSPVSTMPEGLERRLTEEEFVDLIAFLVSQKKE